MTGTDRCRGNASLAEQLAIAMQSSPCHPGCMSHLLVSQSGRQPPAETSRANSVSQVQFADLLKPLHHIVTLHPDVQHGTGG